jgi:hypothetical protein
VREMSAPSGVERTPFGVAVGIGAAAMIAAAEVAAVLFPPSDGWARLAVVSIAAGGYAVIAADARASVVTAGLGYLLFTGFLMNRYGELTWGGTTSLRQLIVFAAAIGIGAGLRWIRTVMADLAREQELNELVATHTNDKESHGG